MPITPPDIKWYKSMTVSDVAANGGRMSNVLSPSGVKNNVLPDVTLAERNAGTTRYRKMFIKVENADNIALGNTRVFLQKNTPGEDSVTFFPGTQRDTQAQIIGSERQYGGGSLIAASSAMDISLQVLTEGAALNYFRSGDLIRITNRPTVSGAGNEEFQAIESVSYAGDVATLTLADPLQYAYPANETIVSSVYQVDEVCPTVDTPVVTSASGVLLADHPITGDSLGTIEQDWTLTFTSATAFNVVGDTLGNIGAGNTSGGVSPINPAFPGRRYFTLPAAAFSGAFAPGDMITFTTSPAAIPVWYKHVVPAGAAAISGNRVVLGVDGESA